MNSVTQKGERLFHYHLLSIGPASGNNDPKLQDVDVEKGTIHTKRHSGEDPIKSG